MDEFILYELGSLAQGIGENLPTRKEAIFLSASHWYPNTKQSHRTCQNVEGNIIDYLGDVITPTEDLTTFKVLINITISTPGAWFMIEDIKQFYLNTLIKRYEYTRLSLNLLPEEIILQYNLQDIDEDSYV